jgi:hypothetical protein
MPDDIYTVSTVIGVRHIIVVITWQASELNSMKVGTAVFGNIASSVSELERCCTAADGNFCNEVKTSRDKVRML